MPPQEGKSTRAAADFPVWSLTQNPDLRIAIASYEHNVARRWGRAIRDDIVQHTDELIEQRVRPAPLASERDARAWRDLRKGAPEQPRDVPSWAARRATRS